MGQGRSAPSGHVPIEHTADLGIRAWGPSIERAFEEAALGLVEVLDVTADRVESTEPIRVEARDPGGLLVDLLNELIFLCDTRDEGIAAVRVLDASTTELTAEVDLGPRAHPSAGTAVKAATYHRLAVEKASDDTAVVRVFLDV